jgi:predicted nuclease with RNAse H fold
LGARRCLGLDLGGASSPTTGVAVVDSSRRPARIVDNPAPQVLTTRRSPLEAEQRLVEFVRECRPDVVAIDAPLTLPPCMSCSGGCRGPDPHHCESQEARALWRGGWNPTSQRACERAVVEALAVRPMPTMQLGVPAARAIGLQRRIRRLRPAPTVIEVYPKASLAAISRTAKDVRPRRRGENRDNHWRATLGGMAEAGLIHLDDPEPLAREHVFDAVVAAFTGWLYPGGLAPPPSKAALKRGWIWCPK